MIRPSPPSGVMSGVHPGGSSPPEPRIPVWLLAIVIAGGLTVFVTLLRYAVDLLVVVCVIWLLGWSLRALADWAQGESVSLWDCVAVAASIAGTVLVLEWLGGSTLLVPRLEPYVPNVLARAVAAAEEKGWVRRAWLQGPLPEAPPAAGQDAGVVAGHEPSSSVTRAGQGVRGGRRVPRSKSVPRDELAAEAAEARGAPGTVTTSTTLESSQLVVTAGTPVHLTAHVTTRSGEPSGGIVVFREGSRVLGSARVDQEGRATLAVRDLPAGTHYLTAEFTEREPFTRSRSQPLLQLVTP